MDYWDDMNDKWGFNDGNAVPPDAEARRAVYILAVNALAEELGSAYRAAEFDRRGMHNWCRVVIVPTGMSLDDALMRLENADAAMSRAIDIAFDMGLDGYVVTTVSTDQAALDDFLTNFEIPEEQA